MLYSDQVLEGVLWPPWQTTAKLNTITADLSPNTTLEFTLVAYETTSISATSSKLYKTSTIH